MQVVFRVDSSFIIGSGHLVRCITLAEALRKCNAEVSFISRKLPGNLINELLLPRNFEVFQLPHTDSSNPKTNTEQQYHQWLEAPWEEDASQTQKTLSGFSLKPNWLIVDHYALDIEWERKIKNLVQHILIIDDLGNRQHDCDILLDQNLQNKTGLRYKNFVPFSCQKLLGPAYALLRHEYTEARKKIKVRADRISNILIFFGGIDPTNETTKAIKAIFQVNMFDFSTTVIVGQNNPHRKQVETICASSSQIDFFCQVDNMAELMEKADLAIGAGGTTAWERCAMGLPTLVISIADNQELICTHLEKAGAAVYLGKKEDVSTEYIAEKIHELLADPGKTFKMSGQAYNLVDALGTNRIVNKIYEQQTK